MVVLGRLVPASESSREKKKGQAPLQVSLTYSAHAVLTGSGPSAFAWRTCALNEVNGSVLLSLCIYPAVQQRT